MASRFQFYPIALVAVQVLGACGTTHVSDSNVVDDPAPLPGDDAGTPPAPPETPPAASGKALKLQILHTNDHHSHLDGATYDLNIEGVATRVQLGGFSRLASVIKERRDDHTLVLNSGELNGTLYFSLFKGEPDFKLFNLLGLDAYQIGNHEFDEGEAVLNSLIAKATFPILGANIHPTSASPLAGAPIKPYIIKEIDGEKVGVIGILKVEKTVHSSMVTDAVQFSEEFSTVAQNVAKLSSQGVNKIIVLSHLGYDMDQKLAAQVDGIDVVIGGDTHELLDSTGEAAKLGLDVKGDYPTIVKSPSGTPVYLAQAWELAHGIGVMNVAFDEKGDVTEATGNIILPVDKPFQRQTNGTWQNVTGVTESQITSAIARSKVLTLETPNSDVVAELLPYTEQLQEFQTKQLGSVAVTLPYDRIPTPFAAGEAPTGSPAAHHVANSFLQYMPKADIAIQNAGGVRTQFLQGSFTVADAYTMLPFSNTIATVDMSGQGIKDVLEDATEYALTTGSTGAFPYCSHMRFDVVKSASKGSRILNVEVKDRKTGVWSPIAPNTIYTVVTNSFTALGKDGYTAFDTAIRKNPSIHEDTHVAYVVPLIEYFQKHLTNNQLPALDRNEYSLKSVRQ